jgi:hypothetical protein
MIAEIAQTAAEAARQAPNLTPVYAILAPLALKALADIGVSLIRAKQKRAEAKAAEAEIALEQAKAYGVSLIKSKNSVSDKAAVVAFCPAHIDLVKEQTKQGVELEHINAELKEIKDDVKVIRTAVGK